ncbi:hypothetical protein SAMN06264364_13420 [Quadrisphaera granulorum]|uniref:Uncharacterized protein n=1 Tax=Quadrisphaera granulorum TaxID=317664 RepID=A0A316ADJ2_9ACTN|nr:hypothetical protein [Quadrisphaera granulorum]PWJ47847.1 hypothetical protein BXY45_13420 [Quadrisphaera granulorum]SZE98614.1 hypothetical protein SAMN06264364_13420 [Quadrisphaera granulorum]
MAELDYALLADYARVDADGTLTAVGAHRTVIAVSQLPAQQVLAAAGRLWMGRREPAAHLSLSARTPEGDVGTISAWQVRPGLEQGEVPGRVSACFAVAVVAPLSSTGPHALVLSVNGEVVAELPFGVVVEI